MPSLPIFPDVAVAAAKVESGEVKSDFGFNSASVRAAFSRKVFLLIGLMLLVVIVIAVVPFLHHDTKTFLQRNWLFYVICFGIFLVVSIPLGCFEKVRRSFPLNLIALSILTLAMGYMSTMICFYHRMISVLLCLIILFFCCLGIIIFSLQTKYDLTSKYSLVFIVGLVVISFGIVAVIAFVAFRINRFFIIYAGIAALIFMVNLTIDFQEIVGGWKYEISPEDYILATILVFPHITLIWKLFIILPR